MRLGPWANRLRSFAAAAEPFLLWAFLSLLAIADGRILGSLVGGAILVLQAGKTRNEAARRAKDALDNSGVKLLGVVVNRIARHRGAYGYYHYDYSEDGRTRKEEGAHRDEP